MTSKKQEKVQNYPFNRLDGIYILTQNAEIIDSFARVSLSPSVLSSSGPCIRRIDVHCSSLTLLMLAKKSPSGFQQFLWLNGGGTTNAPFLWTENPHSILKKQSLLPIISTENIDECTTTKIRAYRPFSRSFLSSAGVRTDCAA